MTTEHQSDSTLQPSPPARVGSDRESVGATDAGGGIDDFGGGDNKWRKPNERGNVKKGNNLLELAGVVALIAVLAVAWWTNGQITALNNNGALEAKTVSGLSQSVTEMKASESAFVLSADLSKTLMNYATAAALGNYATVAALNGYAPKSVSDTVTSMQGQVANIQTVQNAMRDQTQAVTETLGGNVTSLIDRITSDEVKITNLQAQITSLTNGTSSNNASSSANGTVGQVSTVILGNAWTGSTSLQFAAQTVNTSVPNVVASQTLGFAVNNNIGKTINNVQFAIGLQMLDPTTSQPVTLPAGATITVSSLGMIWQSQTTGYNYLLGFANTVSTGMFGGIGAVSQGVGQASYTVTVTLTTTANTQAINIYPIVKVVSYN